jgi:hypothetical protein
VLLVLKETQETLVLKETLVLLVLKETQETLVLKETQDQLVPQVQLHPMCHLTFVLAPTNYII